MELFVPRQSIVRQIWGKGDTILFIFAGAAAEFALNKAVDWLYYTGKLPADPLGRLFSTVSYARRIVFEEQDAALKTIDTISNIHNTLELKRGQQIPDWAYRDVLFMLIHYSIASYELLERKLTDSEKQEVFDVFLRVGQRMNIPKLPTSYNEWLQKRWKHLEYNLDNTPYTKDLFKQYRKHLGPARYFLLREAQKLVAPRQVKKLLGYSRICMIKPVIPIYKLSRKVNLDWFIKALILPSDYKQQIKDLDVTPVVKP
ncbi:MAG TPA: oxygenase MpaB family protein [Flavisolibacter sp.]|nr:oxygenase MpaB family protein [Flavisolibacter sp.]